MSFHFREESNGQEFERREAQRDAAEVFVKTLVAVSEGSSVSGSNGHISEDAVDIRI